MVSLDDNLIRSCNILCEIPTHRGLYLIAERCDFLPAVELDRPDKKLKR